MKIAEIINNSEDLEERIVVLESVSDEVSRCLSALQGLQLYLNMQRTLLNRDVENLVGIENDEEDDNYRGDGANDPDNLKGKEENNLSFEECSQVLSSLVSPLFEDVNRKNLLLDFSSNELFGFLDYTFSNKKNIDKKDDTTEDGSDKCVKMYSVDENGVKSKGLNIEEFFEVLKNLLEK